MRQIRVRATRFLRRHTIFERFRRSYTHQNGFDFQRLEEIQTIPPPVGKAFKGERYTGRGSSVYSVGLEKLGGGLILCDSFL